MWENEAQEQGGALALDSVKNLEITQSLLAANRAKDGGAIWMKNASSKANDNHIVYTQAGLATSLEGLGEHVWENTNWYNNAQGNGNIFRPPPVENGSVNDTEVKPSLKYLEVDGRCNDDLDWKTGVKQ